MAMTTDFSQAGRLCDALGLPATLTLCGWYGKYRSKIYVPVSTNDENHILRKLIGQEAFQKMVDTWPGQVVSIPVLDLSPLQHAGLVHRLTNRGLQDSHIALIAGISPRHISRIKNQLRLEGFAELSEVLPDGDMTESEGGEL